jgi:uncharacterized membrane protein YidH (DUF202 family)
MLLFDRNYKDRGFRNPVVFLEAMVASVLGVVCGLLLFPGEAGLVGVFLIALAQAATVGGLLDRNRQDIWTNKTSPRRANWQLALALLTLFVGVLTTYLLVAMFAPEDRLLSMFGRQLGRFGGNSITEVEYGDFLSLAANNLKVSGVCFLLSLVFRQGGMLLVLAWNASIWGAVFPYLARTAPDSAEVGPFLYLAKTALCITPHLLLEALGYVLVAMGGVFLSRALERYELASAPFNRVALAVLAICAGGVTTILLASAVESTVAPALIGTLFQS